MEVSVHALESILVVTPTPLIGYVGLGPGPEFIPYFLALLGVVGAAFIALVQYPIFALRAFLKRRRHSPGQQEKELEPAAASPIEKELDATHDGTGR
jgi:hypothetical protein